MPNGETSARNVTLGQEIISLLAAFGLQLGGTPSPGLPVHSPVTGECLGSVAGLAVGEAAGSVAAAHAAHLVWRAVPAPRRGELLRLFAEELRARKDELGRLICIEVGKTMPESLGEVQEMIDICDFAVGLSRQLYGLTIATERPNHRMMETWHPLGVCLVVTAFNFPMAVWAWNAALALVCGNSVIWKPSEKAPLTAMAAHAVLQHALERFAVLHGALPEGLAQLALGGREVGKNLAAQPRVALVSATGSVRMGRELAAQMAPRFTRLILELGGNNGAILCPSADQDLALRAILFSAAGTCGQRCTTLRRLFVHDSIYDDFLGRLKKAYESVRIGDPRVSETLAGPLIDAHAFGAMQAALADAAALGGRITGGSRFVIPAWPEAYYVHPAIVEMPEQAGPVLDETFAPILYVLRYRDFADAIAQHNAVAQGLASAIFTRDLREAEIFLSSAGSDCGIANVNIGPSGAEIGGAFGGEKDTGGGRESGSDAWKAYMRRATNTINYGNDLPLAQGVTFDVS